MMTQPRSLNPSQLRADNSANYKLHFATDVSRDTQPGCVYASSIPASPSPRKSICVTYLTGADGQWESILNLSQNRADSLHESDWFVLSLMEVH